ncbi:asparagine N-glycosylation enzyme membrane subunit Stt3 [Bacilli bacterium PM5-3]|nr:asparagine N-glycosylation enzyme membrane subunit Stt3 [Bacilli bacterium PM5-3]
MIMNTFKKVIKYLGVSILIYLILTISFKLTIDTGADFLIALLSMQLIIPLYSIIYFSKVTYDKDLKIYIKILLCISYILIFNEYMHFSIIFESLSMFIFAIFPVILGIVLGLFLRHIENKQDKTINYKYIYLALILGGIIFAVCFLYTLIF